MHLQANGPQARAIPAAGGQISGRLWAALVSAMPRLRRRGTGLADFAIAQRVPRFGLRRQGRGFGPSWHPCDECGHPIDRPSRPRYGSEARRRFARLRGMAADDPKLEEVPF
jgi:hypothetical protein